MEFTNTSFLSITYDRYTLNTHSVLLALPCIAYSHAQ